MGPRTFFFVCIVTLSISFATITSSSHLHHRHSQSLNPHRYHSGALFPRALPTGTCNADTPCENKACCGTNGLCGYSPTECGKGNCTSNCDAKAECGQYGVPGHRNCPLNVCCSKFGFCGSTDDFCGDGCQSDFGGCGKPNRPTCGGGSSVSKRTIGYYESWANTRKCQQVAPEDLNLNGYTHINFAFAFFDPKTFAMAPMDGHSGELYNRFTGLKDKYRGLKTYISVGGWSFTDPGATRTAFSDMASNEGNRQQFIGGLASFMDTYGFDGIDIDWEYPGADDRGGKSQDTANFVALLKDMKSAFRGKYGITVTLPTSYWYLQHFDLKSMQDSVDWFNLMSYDLHGVWDKESKELGPHLAPHTNITEIDLGLDLLWRAGVKPENVVLGQGWYGRSFTLSDPTCNVPNGVCQFSDGAKAGPCSDASGILDNQEIQDIINANNLNPTWDKTAGVKWITWDSNQWVSYDDQDTFQQKRDFANSRCLGGLMVWAMDQVDQNVDNGLAPAPGITTGDQADAKQKSDDLNAKAVCYTTDCDQKCKKGTNPVAQMNGQPGQLSTNDKCPKGKYRNLCCPSGTTMGTCSWRGWRGQGLSCISGCDDGETELTTDTNSHENKKSDKDCTGGLQSYCCKGFKPAPSKDDLKDKAKDAAEDAAIGAAEGVALDIAAKAFCRVMVPALLAPLEAAEAFIPIIGEIADIAEIAATPALILACEKGIEKAGKAEFKIFGKKHTLSMKDPPKTPEPRPPKSSHTTAKTSTATECSADAAGNAKRAPGPVRRCGRGAVPDKHVTTALVDRPQRPQDWEPFHCDFDQMGHACLHYRSVGNHHPNLMTVTCPFYNLKGIREGDGPGKIDWDKKHAVAWRKKANDPSCQADEWPQALVIGQFDSRTHSSVCSGLGCGRPDDTQQFVRLINYLDNNRAGQVLKGQCDDWAPHLPRATAPALPAGAEKEDAPVRSIQYPRLPGGRGPDMNKRGTTWYKYRATYTRQVFTMQFDANIANWQDDGDDGLHINDCQPVQQGVDHRGFLILNDDPWFNNQPQATKDLTKLYDQAPNFKRDLSGLNPDELGIVDGNSTRPLTDEELFEHGIIRCEDKSCRQEMSALGIESAPVVAPPLATPATAMAGTVTAVAVDSQNTAAGSFGSIPESGVSSPNLPRRTSVPVIDELSLKK